GLIPTTAPARAAGSHPTPAGHLGWGREERAACTDVTIRACPGLVKGRGAVRASGKIRGRVAAAPSHRLRSFLSAQPLVTFSMDVTLIVLVASSSVPITFTSTPICDSGASTLSRV